MFAALARVERLDHELRQRQRAPELAEVFRRHGTHHDTQKLPVAAQAAEIQIQRGKFLQAVGELPDCPDLFVLPAALLLERGNSCPQIFQLPIQRLQLILRHQFIRDHGRLQRFFQEAANLAETRIQVMINIVVRRRRVILQRLATRDVLERVQHGQASQRQRRRMRVGVDHVEAGFFHFQRRRQHQATAPTARLINPLSKPSCLPLIRACRKRTSASRSTI